MIAPLASSADEYLGSIKFYANKPTNTLSEVRNNSDVSDTHNYEIKIARNISIAVR
jgi:hypothetical protein